MGGLFVTFEGTEGSGKSTQIALLAERLRSRGFAVRTLREPGGTPIGEEIRHTLKHSRNNAAMTAEAELLLMCASRAQLVREVIRPALEAQEIVLCDRFYDSTIAYQGYGRGLDLGQLRLLTNFVVGDTRPDVTILLRISGELSEQRRLARQANLPFIRDRMEEADRAFFERVEKGYDTIAAAEPERFRVIPGDDSVESIQAAVWSAMSPQLKKLGTVSLRPA